MPNQGQTSLGREIAGLRRSFRTIDRLLKRFSPLLRATGNRAGSSAQGAAPRKLNLTPRRRRQLKLQGQYIGYLRNL